MPWYLRNSPMLDAMREIASDPEKLARFKAAPNEYLTERTKLSKDEVEAILSDDLEDVVRALMSRVDDES